MISSGQVPRELIPGIVWDDAAESRFVLFAEQILAKANQKIDGWRESCLREALWAVETDLHRKFIKARVMEANRCTSNQDKRAVIANWRSKFGDERASRLQRIVRDEKLNKTVVEKW